jgi:glycosyltransferase involved in cell wall biosynthesis
MKLKIAQIAPLWFPVPPKKYGGTERIVYFLTEELVKRGHKVTLFASGDSKTKAKLIAPIKKGLIEQGVPWTDYTWSGFNTFLAFKEANKFDVIHSHWGLFPFFFQEFVKTPLLFTFHNIPKRGDHRWKIIGYFKDKINVVFISQSEKNNSQVKFKKSWVVYNGIDVSYFKFNSQPEDHFVWIGRVSPEKGIENAIKVAKKLGIKLLLAGQIQEMRKEYFKKKIKPHLSKKIKYLGEIPQEKLPDFYGKAKALLYPIEWEEPFGLVMAEAMACGTPVIVFDRGSAREVVKNGVTGFVVKNNEEMIKAIKKIEKIDRKNCRERVEKYFTYQKMVSDYEKIYYQLYEKT